MRSIIKATLPLFRTLNKPPIFFLPASFASGLQQQVRFSFAKVSKKEEQRSQKKKQKSQARESLGGDVSEIDLNKYEESYSNVIVAYKEQLSTIRFGRLEASSVSAAQVKVGGQTMPLNSLAQVSSKSANSCVVSPFDSSHVDIIERALRVWDDSLEIKRGENSLTLTQVSQGKEVRDKLIQKVKKLANDRKQELKKLRSGTQDQLRKYKKIVPEDRLRNIENEAKTLFDKKNQEIDKIEKEKEKELLK